ncbi:hypothetical protein RB195_020408 [Necator americanus]|uniref:ADF-H domain-containing protein n=1 Tax=Necator americanus TaxID=51031 RepID=A0ABR1CIP7_NECAM
MRDRPVISIEIYTIYCGDADENKAGGCAIAVRNDYKNLVEEFDSTSSRSSRCAFVRLRDRRGSKLWIVSAPTETAEDNSKDAFYDELNALLSKKPSQRVVIVRIDANDSDHRPVLLSFKIRFHKRNREVPLQPKIDMAGLKDEECRKKFRQSVCLFMLEYGPGRSLAMRTPSQSAFRTKRSRFYCRGRSLPLHLRKQNPRTILYVSRAALVTLTRKSVLEGSCIVNCNNIAITGGR